MTPELAIVIPAYKATFLRETLESIAAQTDKRFHLYIGDDCSPYDLAAIVDEFRERIPLTYKRFDDNLGGRDLVAQWERCIALSKDEPYIWLFSDDDTMAPGCVGAFYEAIEQYPDNELFRFNVKVIDNDGNKLRDVIYPPQISSRELYLSKIKGTIECYVVEYIFKRSVYNREGGFVSFDLAWGSDLATWVKFGKKTGIITMESPDISWRSSGQNISTDYNQKTIDRKIAALIACLRWGEAEFPDDETREVNERGFAGRLSNIALVCGYTSVLRGIGMYSTDSIKRLNLLLSFTLRYIYKKLK